MTEEEIQKRIEKAIYDERTWMVHAFKYPYVSSIEFDPISGHVDLYAPGKAQRFSSLREIIELYKDGYWKDNQDETGQGQLVPPQTRIRELEAENQALQAHNKRLVEALHGVNEHLKPRLSSGYPSDETMELYKLVRDALCEIPAQALEAERRREEVIRAARNRYQIEESAWALDCANGGKEPFREYWTDEDKELFDTVEALEALEGKGHE